MGNNENINGNEEKSRTRAMIIVAMIGAIGVILGSLVEAFLGLVPFHKGEYEFWSVKGHLCLIDSEIFDNTDVVMSIKPPEQELYRNGMFVIKKVPIKKGDVTKPSLLIKKTGYEIAEVILEDKPHKFYENHGLRDYSISYDRDKKLIEIHERIELDKKNIMEGEEEE